MAKEEHSCYGCKEWVKGREDGTCKHYLEETCKFGYCEKETEKDDVDGYLIVEKFKPCYICGGLTNRLNTCYESYICSEKCEHAMDNLYENFLERVSGIEDENN